METDTAGQERFHSLGPMYYRGAHAAILGFDVTRREGVDNCDRWLSEIRGSRNKKCVLVAVGNKIDLVGQREVSTEEAREHFGAEGVPYFETSAKTGEGVNELFEAVVKLVIDEHFQSLVSERNDNEAVEREKGSRGEPRGKRDDKCIIS